MKGLPHAVFRVWGPKMILTMGFTRMRALRFAGSFAHCPVPLSAHPVTFLSSIANRSPRCSHPISVAEDANVSRGEAKITEIDSPAAINITDLRPI